MIAQETIEAVKARADIVALVGESVRLQKKGRRYSGLCPFHSEKTPSFSVNAEKGFYYCFGCQAHGGAIDFVMHREGYTFPEAVKALAERYGVVVDENTSPEERQEADRRKRERDQLYDMNQLAATFFRLQLTEHPLGKYALAELERRGLAPGQNEAIDNALAAFHIGYAPYGWDGFARYVQQQGVSADVAVKLGLVVPRRSGGGHYDQFRHRLMFAVSDKGGRVIAFSGRALDDPSDEDLGQIPRIGRRDEDRGPPKYVNSPESPIYVKGQSVFGLYQGRGAIRSKEEAVLVEGNFDVLALQARGVGHVVAALGTAFTVEQAKLIKRYAPVVITLFDADEAGQKAAVKLRKPAREAGLRVKVAELPEGTDPDDFARAKGAEAVERLLSGARDMLEYVIDRTLRGGGGSLRDKQERIAKVMRYLSAETDPTVRSMAKAYADKISGQMIIDGSSPTDIRGLERMVSRALSSGPESGAGGPSSGPGAGPGGLGGPSSRSRPRADQVALAVVGALLDFPELCDDTELETALGDVSGDSALAVVAVASMWHEKKALDVAELLDLLPLSVHSFAVARLAAPVFSELAEARRELLENTKKLRRLSLKGDKALKLEELSRADRLGDSEAQDELLRELSRRSKEKLGLS